MASFNKLHQLADDIPGRGQQLVSAYAAYWQSAAMQLAPVKDGDLKDSIAFTMRGPYEAAVTVGMAYGIHQEFGTMDMPAQPFMRPSRAALAPSFKRDLKKVFDV